MARKKKENVAEVEVTEVEVQEVEVKEVVKSASGFDAHWPKVERLIKQGQSPNTVINGAKNAFGSKFDQDKYVAYRAENECTSTKDKVEAVWKSQ